MLSASFCRTADTTASPRRRSRSRRWRSSSHLQADRRPDSDRWDQVGQYRQARRLDYHRPLVFCYRHHRLQTMMIMNAIKTA